MWRIALVCLLLIVSPAPAPTLRHAAQKSHRMIGTAVRPALLSEPAYSETLSREFNMVEPEDAMKWSVVRRNRGTFDFSGADKVVEYAHLHGMKVRGHCLVWDHDNPDWLNRGGYSPEQLSRILEEHIRTEASRYAGRVFAWDVVNEALDENGHLRDSIWYNRPGIGLQDKGPAYIEQAFRWAHEADPGALLFYNEAEAEGLNRKSDAVYAMLKNFKQRGVPINGVGLQMHLADFDFDTSALAENIARLTALGLQVHITELDISLPVDSAGRTQPSDLQKQSALYGRIVNACVQSPGCTAIQMWGFTDKYSWIGSHSHQTRGAAVPFDRDYKPKPAYDAILRALSASK